MKKARPFSSLVILIRVKVNIIKQTNKQTILFSRMGLCKSLPNLLSLVTDRRKIRFTEDNEKCRHLKKLLCGRCLSVLGPEPHTPPLLYSIRVYTILYSFTQGRGNGGELYQGQQFTKLGRKYQHD